ncbi:hypothetical protein GCM10023210_09050 [Chryseobacterium ginsengisoli]|uniref:Uncharacterized protein n=1 Tax=Chryseobacterium ginsengisoli TaxID=363853 RepID=A0ABP9LZR3_9FLAO
MPDIRIKSLINSALEIRNGLYVSPYNLCFNRPAIYKLIFLLHKNVFTFLHNLHDICHRFLNMCLISDLIE